MWISNLFLSTLHSSVIKIIENYNFIKIFSRARFKYFFVLVFYHSVLISASHNLWQIMKVSLTSMVLLVPFKPVSPLGWCGLQRSFTALNFLGTDAMFLSIDVTPSSSLHCQHSNSLFLEVKLSQTFLSSVSGVLSGAQWVCAAPARSQWL